MEPTPRAAGALDRNRRTFAWKCFGLTAEEMQRTLGPSTVTLAGLVKHVALVEDYYFSLGLGEVMPQPWRDVDFEADPDWEWRTATDDSPDERRRVAIANQGAVAGIVSCATFGLGFLIAGGAFETLALANACVVVLHLASFPLTRKLALCMKKDPAASSTPVHQNTEDRPSAVPTSRPSDWRGTSSGTAGCCSDASAWSGRSAVFPSAA